MGKSVLLIGGSGFIGSSVAGLLVNQGCNVTVAARSSEVPDGISGLARDFPELLNYASGDCSNEEFVSGLIEAHEDIVYLAHSWKGRALSAGRPIDLTGNLEQALCVMSISAQFGRPLILISTGGALYGETDSFPIHETQDANPVSAYGLTKLMIESYAGYFARTAGLMYTCLRPGNAYGEGQLPFRGQGFVATAIARAIQGVPVQIYGRPGAVRDYVYISDLAEAIVLAVEKGAVGKTYNIGTGQGSSNDHILDMLDPVCAQFRIEIIREYLPGRQQDVSKNILDSGAFIKDTGWRPRVGLCSGLEKAFNWLRENPSLLV